MDQLLPFGCCRQMQMCPRPPPDQFGVWSPGTSTEGLDTRSGITPGQIGAWTSCLLHTKQVRPQQGTSEDQATSTQERRPVSVETSRTDAMSSSFCVRRKAASQTDKPADKKEDESQAVSAPPPARPGSPCSVDTPGPAVLLLGFRRARSSRCSWLLDCEPCEDQARIFHCPRASRQVWSPSSWLCLNVCKCRGLCGREPGASHGSPKTVAGSSQHRQLQLPGLSEEKEWECSVVSDSLTPRTIARQAPLSVGFSRQEHWSGLPCPPPGGRPKPGTEPRSLAL